MREVGSRLSVRSLCAGLPRHPPHCHAIPILCPLLVCSPLAVTSALTIQPLMLWGDSSLVFLLW